MIRPLYGADREVAQWIMDRLGGGGLDGCRAIGVLDDDTLIAGVAFFNFRHGSMEISVAAESRGWMTRRILRELWRYPFAQCGCEHVTACIPKHRRKTRRMAERLGFTLEGVQKRAFDGSDLCLYGLLREDSKVMRNEKP